MLTDQDRKYVYVLGADNTAQRRDIVLGRAWSTACAWSTSGLKPSDQVVVDGVQKVFFPGMPVEPTTVAMRKQPRRRRGDRASR